MKHLFNFEPIVKFRAAHDFTTTAILILLYSIIIIKLSLIIYTYYNHNYLVSFFDENSIFIENIIRNRAKLLKSNFKISIDEIKEKESKLLKFYEYYNFINFSWRILFEELENILPNNIKISKISIKPFHLTKIYLEGESQTINDITLLLQNLNNSESFLKPRIIRHSKNNYQSEKGTIIFLLETTFKSKHYFDAGVF